MSIFKRAHSSAAQAHEPSGPAAEPDSDVSNSWLVDLFQGGPSQESESSGPNLGQLGAGAGIGSKVTSTGLDWMEATGKSKVPMLGTLGKMAGLFSKGTGLEKQISAGDGGDVIGGALDVGEAGAKLVGSKGVADALGPMATTMSIINGLKGAFDEDKSTGDRVVDGVDAAANSASLYGELGGATLGGEGGLLASELGGITGVAPILASVGAVLGSGLLGWKTGGLIAEGGDSHWARDVNMGGTDRDGNKRTLGDYWTDVAADTNTGMDQRGDRLNSRIDQTGARWGSWMDHTLGGGGGAVENAADVAGDAVNFGVDTAGDIAGGAIALGMGTAGGIADGATAAVNYLSSDPSPEEQAAYESYVKSTYQYKLGSAVQSGFNDLFGPSEEEKAAEEAKVNAALAAVSAWYHPDE